MKSNRSQTDIEWERQKNWYETQREVGEGPFCADFSFAERWEAALREIAEMDYSTAAVNGTGYKAVIVAKEALGE